jgi:hypothetical protein
MLHGSTMNNNPGSLPFTRVSYRTYIYNNTYIDALILNQDQMNFESVPFTRVSYRTYIYNNTYIDALILNQDQMNFESSPRPSCKLKKKCYRDQINRKRCNFSLSKPFSGNNSYIRTE